MIERFRAQKILFICPAPPRVQHSNEVAQKPNTCKLCSPNRPLPLCPAFCCAPLQIRKIRTLTLTATFAILAAATSSHAAPAKAPQNPVVVVQTRFSVLMPNCIRIESAGGQFVDWPSFREKMLVAHNTKAETFKETFKGRRYQQRFLKGADSFDQENTIKDTITTVYSVCSDALAVLGYTSDAQCHFNDAEVMTVAVTAALFFASNHALRGDKAYQDQNEQQLLLEAGGDHPGGDHPGGAQTS